MTAMTRTSAQPLLTLENVSHLVSRDGKPDETLGNIVTLVGNRLEVDVCSVYLLEPNRANLLLAATVGLNQECVGELRMGLYEGLAGLVAQQVRPLAVEEAAKHPRFKYFPEAGENPVDH